MAKRRKPTPVTLTVSQRGRLESLWFVYGNHGPKETYGNHQFIQGLLEHGLDLRPLQSKRTAKRDIPTAECVAAVEAVLCAPDDAGEGVTRVGRLRLIPSPDAEQGKLTPDTELKSMLDKMRSRLPVTRGRGGFDAGGEDAA